MIKRKNNNGIFYVVISLFAILAIGFSVYAYSLSQNVNVAGDYNYYEANGFQEDSLGAVSGPDIYADVNVYGTLTYGSGSYLATSTSAQTYTLVEKDLRNHNYIDVMNNKETLTWTLPATSTMISLLPEIGSSQKWLIHNATTTASKTLTIAAPTGVDLVAVTANDDVIDPGEYTQLTCTHIYYRDADNENIMCIVDELANAD